jgi:hypothetical protein
MVNVFNRDGENISLYVDGSLVDSCFIDISGSIDADDNFYLSFTSTQEMNGTLDEVLIFNRSLSAEEIQSLYNSSQYSYEHNFTGLSDGDYKFIGYAVDKGGNTNKTSSNVPFIS